MLPSHFTIANLLFFWRLRAYYRSHHTKLRGSGSRAEDSTMAAPSSNIAVVLGKFKEELTCPICHEILNEPKSLPCLHSFCQECLENYARLRTLDADREEGAPPDVRDIVPCPKCKFQAQLDSVGGEGEGGSVAASLKTNACLKNLVRHYIIAQEVVAAHKTRCGFCPAADNEAVAFCQTRCNRFLCQPCWDSHKRMTLSSGHTIVTLEDVRSNGPLENAPVLQSYRTRKCSEHFVEGRDDPNERMTDINIYCFPCRKVICCMCAVTEHQPHNPKKVASSIINDAEHRPLIEAKIREAERIMTEQFDISSVKLQQVKFLIEDAKLNTEKRIKESDFVRLESELEDGKESLLRRIENIRHLHLNNLRRQRKELGSKRAAIQRAINFVDRRLNLGCAEDIVHFNKEMNQQVSRLLRESKEHPPECAYKRVVNFVHEEQNMAGVMGNVSAEPCIENFTADKIHDVDFTCNKEIEFTITARDVLRNEATANGDMVLVELQPVGQPADQIVRAKATKLRNGKCLVTLTPQRTGDHTLSIQVARAGQFQHIQNSPFRVVVAVNIGVNLYEV